MDIKSLILSGSWADRSGRSGKQVGFDVRNAVLRVNNGESCRQVALDFGISPQALEYHVSKFESSYGVRLNRRRWTSTNDMSSSLGQVTAGSESRLQAAARLGLSKSTVRYHVRKLAAAA